MNKIKWLSIPAYAFGILLVASISGQTIAEKKAGVVTTSGGDLSPAVRKALVTVNHQLSSTQEELKLLYQRVQLLYQRNAPLEDYELPIARINALKQELYELESDWRQAATSDERDTSYALWYQPDTTIGQLINDYGAEDYVYVTTPEIAKMKVSVNSSLPIPRSSWDEILQLILTQSGIGVRQLSPLLRELYLLQKDLSAPALITDQREDLNIYPGDAKAVFVLTPEPADGKRVWFFLSKFVNPASTSLQMIGRDILLVGNVDEIRDLLKVYDFVASHRGDREYKTVNIRNIDVDEMARILGTIFDIINEGPSVVETVAKETRGPGAPGRPPGRPDGPPPGPKPINKGSPEASGNSSLRIVPLKHIAQALFLVGTREEIKKAEEIIQQVEEQLGESRMKVVFSYRVRHSDADELAGILEKIYTLMMESNALTEAEEIQMQMQGDRPPLPPPPIEYEERAPLIQRGIYDQGYYLTDRFIVNPDRRRPRRPPANQGRDNFIVDPKTGLLIMVVEVDALPKIKDLIKKLDVPKKMVQVEVMLVEQVIRRNNTIGLNLLQIGTEALQKNATSLIFNAPTSIPGITDFIISRAPTCSGIPAYDAIYRFLLSRDDIRINASPSLLILNETEGIIEIEEEISVETGIFVIPNAGTQTLNSSFARARYGIRIEITPTIHMHEPDDTIDDEIPDYVTLVSDIKFETIDQNISANVPSTPNVTRRVLSNEARIADGQTVIIGGLRRKNSADIVRAIPFLGEIPGFGKLFSTTALVDQTTEMFIFMTPKIVSDPSEELECIKMEEMQRRPGDVPGFMCAMEEAKRRERNRALTGTMIMLFGLPPSRCVDKEACEYNGRD